MCRNGPSLVLHPNPNVSKWSLSGYAWQIVEQSEIQLNLLAEASTFSSTLRPSVPIMPPILTEFEQLHEEELKSNSSSSQAASVCANGVCTIY